MKSLYPFIKLFKKQLWWILLGLALSCLTILSSIGLLSLSGWFISASAFASLSYQAASSFNFFLPSGGVRAFSMARIGGRYGERVTTHEATFKILTNIRVWFYEKIEPVAPSCLARYKSGDILTRIVSDIDALDGLYIRIILPVIVFIFTAATVLFFFSFFNLTIAVISVAMLVFTGIFVPLISWLLAKKTANELASKTACLKTETVEYVQGLSVLKLFQSDKEKISKLSEHSNKLIASQSHMASITGFSSALMTIFLGSTIVVTVWLACELVVHQQLNGANIALLALGVIGMYESVLMLPVAFQYLGKVVRSAERLHELANQKNNIKYGLQEYTAIDISFNYQDVSFSYHEDKKNPVLAGINIEVAAQQKIAIVGETGSGKTTLMYLLARFGIPSSGSIYVNGISIEEFTEKSLRGMFTIVQQNEHVFNTTIRENLLLGNAFATEDEMHHVLKVVQLEKYILGLDLGIDSATGEKGCYLSGGQRKRLVLARALLRDTPVYVMDEPTEGLDKKTELELIDSLLNYLSEKTLVIITHSPNTANKMNDQYVMQAGKLIAK